MSNTAYRLGFIMKLAELKKTALSEDARSALRSYIQEENKQKGGVPDRVPLRFPKTFKESLQYKGERLKNYLGSTGRGLASAAGVAGIRGLQGGLQMATGIPEIIDSILFGRIMGFDEGRGLLGRRLGKMNRAFDSKVHSLRKWVDDYDYKYRLNSGFNRFMNGALADSVGGFIGWGGLGGLMGSSLIGRHIGQNVANKLGRGISLASGTVGATIPWFGGANKELRDRENMLRALQPFDRIGIDPTSTATNQAAAPTLEEYRRYHTPVIPNMPTSATGYINVPRNWWFTSSGSPIQTREFGT